MKIRTELSDAGTLLSEKSRMQRKYRAMNELYQKNAINQRCSPAKQDQPFLLNFRPVLSIKRCTGTKKEYNNSGTIAAGCPIILKAKHV